MDASVAEGSVSAKVDVPFRASLAAIAVEIGRVAAAADGLQDTLSPLFRDPGLAGEAAQSLDEITQMLQGLVAYVSAVAAFCPPHWVCDLSKAGDGLHLAAQYRRLALWTEPLTVGESVSAEPEIW